MLRTFPVREALKVAGLPEQAISEGNVELVRALYGEMSKSGWDAVIANRELIAPDVEADFSDVYPDAPIIRGVEQALRWGESGPWGRSAKVEAERILDVDDERVLVLAHVTARAAGERPAG